MTQLAADRPSRLSLPREGWLVAAGLVCAYFVVFAFGSGGPISVSLASAFTNVAVLAPLLAAMVLLHAMPLFQGSAKRQGVAHLLGAVAFSLAWYVLIGLTNAFLAWQPGRELDFQWLTGRALPWQLFQGLTVYAALAAWSLRRAPAAPAQLEVSAPPAALDRLLLRRGEEIAPVAVGEIVCIRGADDYAEVFTRKGPHLARMTLAALAARLPGERFLRVHRSWIINLDHLLTAEPTGDGRLTLHLAAGRSLTTSRAGAQALKREVV